MDGRALTAGELARAAGVTAPTASGHLAKLSEGKLLGLARQGRHRYYRLSGADVAATLEALMALDTGLRVMSRPTVTGPRDRAMRRARMCYDHLAGELAVAIADAMVGRGQLDLDAEGAALTASGQALLQTLGVTSTGSSKAGFCRPCLDWSERRLHLGGAVGAALARGFEAQGWIRRASGSRAVAITRRGETALHRHFGWRAG